MIKEFNKEGELWDFVYDDTKKYLTDYISERQYRDIVRAKFSQLIKDLKDNNGATEFEGVKIIYTGEL